MSHHRRTSLLLASALAIVVAACAGGGASSRALRATRPPPRPPARSAPASARSTTRPAPTDVILRYDEGGGFVMPAFAAANVPHFTLYGDGTVVFRDPAVEAPPTQGSVFVDEPAPDREAQRGADPGACSRSRSARAAWRPPGPSTRTR